MQSSRALTVLIAIAMVLLVAANVFAIEGVSPGAVDRMAQVNNACPTFSWGALEGTRAFEIIGYSLPEGADRQEVLSSEHEVLYTRVAGSATAWTPSADQCFAPGGKYVWFVRAVTELIGDQVIEAGEWSAGRYFEVPAGPSAEDVARAVEVLKQWEATNGGGSPSLPLSSGTDSGSGTRARLASDSHQTRRGEAGSDRSQVRVGRGARSALATGSGSSHLKSVPTASAAIRGQHPDTSGERYGVVGTSASTDGAGVAAANLDGGPDLVLDGSVDGEPDTMLWQGGIDRAAASHQTFAMGNSGAGRLHVSIDGDMTSDVVRTEQVVVNGMTVVDDSGDWLGNGSTVPCVSCVTSPDIADGTITDNDLAEDAVTEEKIEHGAVGTTKLQNNSVTSAKIADGGVATADLAADSVTGTKIADGAVDAAALRNNAVTTDTIADGTIVQADLALNSVSTNNIQNDAVVSGKILDGTIGSADLAAGAVTSAKIADGSIASADLANNAVTGAKIADGSITSDDIGSSQIGPSHIVNMGVNTADLATGAVTSTKIEDGTITAADVDPTGGIYASKSAVYTQTSTGVLDPGACGTVVAACLDANDLPLEGYWGIAPSSPMRVRHVWAEYWDDNTIAAQWTAEICYEPTGTPLQSFSSSIVCLSVPGP